MIFNATFKDPDTVHEALEEAVKDELQSLSLTGQEIESIIETRTERYYEAVAKFVEYGEYITVEFDTDQGTARVVPVEETK